MDVIEDFEEEEKDFEMPGLPFAVLVDASGLIAWKGHPKRRVFEEDLIELRKEHMLFETEDYHDDPDKPFKDPDESEMQKDLEVQKRKPKEVLAVLEEVNEKVKFFCDKLKGNSFTVERKVPDLITEEEEKKLDYPLNDEEKAEQAILREK